MIIKNPFDEYNTRNKLLSKKLNNISHCNHYGLFEFSSNMLNWHLELNKSITFLNPEKTLAKSKKELYDIIETLNKMY